MIVGSFIHASCLFGIESYPIGAQRIRQPEISCDVGAVRLIGSQIPVQIATRAVQSARPDIGVPDGVTRDSRESCCFDGSYLQGIEANPPAINCLEL